MSKKKAKAPKARSPRKKRLRLVDNSPLDLTDAQQQDLRELYRPLGQLSGLSLDLQDTAGQRRLAFSRLLYLYVEALCCDARAENASHRKGQTTSLRRQVVAELGKLCGRDLSPDEIIKALSKHAPVPKFAANVIRRDYLRVTV